MMFHLCSHADVCENFDPTVREVIRAAVESWLEGGWDPMATDAIPQMLCEALGLDPDCPAADLMFVRLIPVEPEVQ